MFDYTYLPSPSLFPSLVEMMLKIMFIFSMNMGVFAPLLGWVERKQSALMQDRIGANRAEIFGFTVFGLLHVMTDAIKLLVKEDFIPRGADRTLHYLAPFLAVVPALVAFAVIPFGGKYTLWGHEANLVIADLNVGMLYIFAVGSLASYGAVIAGWASNNSWSMMGGIRVGAQMLSYEVAMGLTLVGVFMVYGSLQLTTIGMAQENFFHWGIFLQPLGFILFITCALAENKRTPFDMPEAESELIAGYFTEYSGLKFAMFWMAEFLEMVTIAAVLVALFFGGWHIPFITHQGLISAMGYLFGNNFGAIAAMLIHVAVFWLKVVAWIVILMLIRWSLPRFRFDQVMKLGWKIVLPLALVNIFITGLVILAVR